MAAGPRPGYGKVHGRRRGRPLRLHKARLVETLLPRLAIDLPVSGDHLDPAGLFDAPKADLWLEIGFGGGEHLAAQAAAHPDIGFIGCEPFLNGVAALLAHIEARGLGNIRILPDDARPLLDALPDASVGRCFVLFPDPWPKKRHAERRFIGPENLDRLARVLKGSAELRLATDDPGLMEWMTAHAGAHPAFAAPAAEPAGQRVRPADWPETRYEVKALAKGRRPWFVSYRRKAGAGV